MKKILGLFKALVLLSIMALVAGTAYLQFWSQQPLPLRQQQIIAVEPGSTLYGLSRSMQNLGYLDSAFLFRLYARIHPASGMIQAGEYEIQPGMTPVALLAKLGSGDVLQYYVTLIDGQTYESFKRTLQQTAKLQFTLGDVDLHEVMLSWGDNHVSPEGLFYPDTYDFRNGDTDVSILKRAYQRMQQQLQSSWENRAGGLPYTTAYEALIMASIVEKETGVASERALIAGVFVNRLRHNMRLQTDPTVIYGLGEYYQGNLTKAHLKQITPYNTYRIKGLPPTPIANPGLAAIEAALHPATTDALYFVAKGDGSHQFSVTLAEHEAAVKKYQWQRRSDYRSAPN